MTEAAPRRLYLLRHAKSSWADPGLDDHDRPLAARGEDAVDRLRRHLDGRPDAPELVLTSSARRTTATVEGIAAALPSGTEVRVEGELYAASGAALLARLRRVADEVASVMLVGHNPGLEDLALQLVGPAAGDEGVRRMATKFPTGALATIAFAGSWSDLGPGTAMLESFVVPRDL